MGSSYCVNMRFAAASHSLLKPRRIGAVLAIVGLLFAATVASVTQSIAMPMMAGTMSNMVPHAMVSDKSATSNAADHDCDTTMAADETPDRPSAPCEQGCLLCTSCSLVSTIAAGPPSIETPNRYDDYLAKAYLPVADITPIPPNEPPRI